MKRALLVMAAAAILAGSVFLAVMTALIGNTGPNTLIVRAAEESFSEGHSLLWPVRDSGPGDLTDLFGYRVHPLTGTVSFHSGIDIGAYMGTEVLAASSGTVIRTGYHFSYGNYIIMDAGTDPAGRSMRFLYAHLSGFACSSGEKVSRGDVIGYVGSTGDSTGPHLHFEVSLGGETVDPMDYFSTE